MNNKKRLTRGDFETLMGLFGGIIQSCDRPTAKEILYVLRDMEHTIFDFNEEHGINQCDCSECKSDRKEEGIVSSNITQKDLDKVKKDVSKHLNKLRSTAIKDRQSLKDKAYQEWKKDFLKKKQKKDSEGEK